MVPFIPLPPGEKVSLQFWAGTWGLTCTPLPVRERSSGFAREKQEVQGNGAAGSSPGAQNLSFLTTLLHVSFPISSICDASLTE